MEVFFEEEPTSSRSCPAFDKKKSARTMPLGWVFFTVKEICHSMGHSCEGFEKELLAFFTGIEASHSYKESASSSKCGKKKAIAN
jgi:hypothetical protein